LKGTNPLKTTLKVEPLFTELTPRTLRAFNLDMEGYSMGLDRQGQYFLSVTTSNYPFKYINHDFALCTTNTIYLKTNLNNIGVSNTGVTGSDIVLAEEEPSLSKRIGALEGVLPDGEMHRKAIILQGFDGKVVAMGYKEPENEQAILVAAFSNHLKTSRYQLLPEGNSQLHNVNIVDVDCIRRFLQEARAEKPREEEWRLFKARFIQSQLGSFSLMNSAADFFAELEALVG
jgi:hypothetical protein